MSSDLKDAKGRFSANDLWGDGWGWALFEAKDPKRNVATNYRTDCKTCHIPAKKDYWVYVRGYPALAKPNLSPHRSVRVGLFLVCSAIMVPPPSRLPAQFVL